MSAKINLTATAIAAALLGTVGAWAAGQDKYTVKVPNGLSFSEFRGYEDWPVVSISQNGKVVAAILGNPTIMEAFRSGIPANGKPFPDGSRMAKLHWLPRKQESYPGPPTVAGALENVDFMVKDSKRFTDSAGWGWAVFDYHAATDSFTPGNKDDKPPQANNAKCGLACHTKVSSRDYVFTELARR